MDISNFNYVDYIYFFLLLIFLVFFGIKGATKSISYSLKIIFSVSIPFIFYKRILKFSLEKFNSNYLFSIYEKNSIFLKIIYFIIIFIIVYIIFTVLEKALNLKSPSQLEFKILDIIIGAMYGVFLFSIIFFFIYITFLKNHVNEKNLLIKFNISIYENLMYKDEIDKGNQKQKKYPKRNKENDNNKLY